MTLTDKVGAAMCALMGCFWVLVFTAVAALVVLLGAAALSWLAGLFGGAL